MRKNSQQSLTLTSGEIQVHICGIAMFLYTKIYVSVKVHELYTPVHFSPQPWLRERGYEYGLSSSQRPLACVMVSLTLM